MKHAKQLLFTKAIIYLGFREVLERPWAGPVTSRDRPRRDLQAVYSTLAIPVTYELFRTGSARETGSLGEWLYLYMLTLGQNHKIPSILQLTFKREFKCSSANKKNSIPWLPFAYSIIHTVLIVVDLSSLRYFQAKHHQVLKSANRLRNEMHIK